MAASCLPSLPTQSLVSTHSTSFKGTRLRNPPQLQWDYPLIDRFSPTHLLRVNCQFLHPYPALTSPSNKAFLSGFWPWWRFFNWTHFLLPFLSPFFSLTLKGLLSSKSNTSDWEGRRSFLFSLYLVSNWEINQGGVNKGSGYRPGKFKASLCYMKLFL